MATDRRTFLQLLTTSALTAAFPASIARALENPRQQPHRHHRRRRAHRLHDAGEPLLRSLLRHAARRPRLRRSARGQLPSGDPVWYQPNGGNSYVLPFHPGAPNLGLQFLQDLAHDWTTTHVAWNDGNNDQWVPQKGTTTMAHLTRSDIPFHYALADAFTVCDAYHCSLLGPTDPNRYHMWTGWVGNDGKNGGPVIDNAEAGYDWSTYPELLQNAGVSWKIYQDIGEGLDASGFWGWTGDNPYIGNYGDNSLLYFHQYQNAPQGRPLAEKARTGTNILQAARSSTSSAGRTEAASCRRSPGSSRPKPTPSIPTGPPTTAPGTSRRSSTSSPPNPEVWSKTAFFLMYDENDGFFDHMVPPVAAQSRAQGKSTVDTTNEIFAGNSEYPAGPYGLGVRVPMIVISPWSKGGYVNSEVFDHTSLIRFIEKRFGPQHPGLTEPNITKWRRAVTGDLTSAFNFISPNDAKVPLPSTAAYVPPDNQRHPDYVPTPPTDRRFPPRSQGRAPPAPCPMSSTFTVRPISPSRTFRIDFGNTGKATAVYHVRSGNTKPGPWTYTVSPARALRQLDTLNNPQRAYDLSVYGPNGFLRSFKGSTSGKNKANLRNQHRYDNVGHGITLEIANRGATCQVSHLRRLLRKEQITHNLRAGEALTKHWNLKKSYGWYDFVIEVNTDPTFQRHIAGHVETGEESMTDPAIGAPTPNFI